MEENKLEIQIVDKKTSQTTENIDRSYKISGSFKQAFIVDTAIAFIGTGPVVVFNAPVTAMEQLSPVLKGLLASSPLLITAINQIPVTHAVQKNGGKKAIIFVQGVALIGLLALTALSATTDITTINSFDYRFAITLLSGYTIGMGSGTFPLLIDSMKWAVKENHLPIIQSVFGGIVDSSNSITPIVIHLLKPFGFTIPFAFYSGTLLLGILTAAKFLHASPFDQLKNKFPIDLAKQKAIEFGQLPIMLEAEHQQLSWKKLIKEYLKLSIDSRALVLDFSFFITLGSFFVTGTIFPSLLKNGFAVEETEAIYSSSIANIIAIFARFLAGKMISKWDNETGGVKIHLLGCGLSVVSAIPLIAFDLPRWALYSSIAIMNTGFGVGVVTPLNLALPWSKPKNKDLKEFEVSTMFGLLSTTGTIGGILLPLVLGLMVEQIGNKGYQYYFLLVIAMMTMSAASVTAVHHNVNQKSGSLFGNTMNFFLRTNKTKTPKYIFSSENEEKEENVVISRL